MFPAWNSRIKFLFLRMKQQKMHHLKPFLQAAGAFTGCFAIGAQWFLVIENAEQQSLSYFAELIRFLSYMTIWTNILVTLGFLCPLLFPASGLSKFLQSPLVQGGLALYIFVVALVYHFFLAQIWEPAGLQYIADVLLHYMVPFLYLLFWACFAPKGYLKLTSALIWLVYPLVYATYALVRGAVTGGYPYPFIDVAQLGYGLVLRNVFLLGLAYLLLGGLVVAADKLLSTRRNTAPAGGTNGSINA